MKFKSLAAAVAALLIPMAVWAAPVAVTMTPAVQSVGQGASVTVTVRIDGLAALPDQLSGYDIRVNYDTSRLTFSSEAFLADAFMGPPILENFDSSTAGLLIDQLDSFLGPEDLATMQSGVNGFDLFSLTFTAANVDAFTNLSFLLVPNFTDVLGNTNGNVLDATYTGACVGIGATACGDVTTPVPEPETYSMMALGLLVAAAYGRRAKRRSKAVARTA